MRSIVLVMVVALAGCSAFVPFYHSTWMYGTVTASPSGAPLGGVVLSMYGKKFTTSSSGCFKVSVTPAIPFALSASAEGYKAVRVPVEGGHFKVTVHLAPASSNNVSYVTSSEVSEAEFNRAASCT